MIVQLSKCVVIEIGALRQQYDTNKGSAPDMRLALIIVDFWTFTMPIFNCEQMHALRE